MSVPAPSRSPASRAFHTLRRDPWRLFKLDGLGALLSTLALGVALPLVTAELGVAPWALHLLALVALGLCAFGLACLLRKPTAWRGALRALAMANALYPLLTCGVLWLDGVALRALGVAYFAVEFAIVWSLAALELSVAGTRGQDSP